MPANNKVSLDEIMSKRQFSVRSAPKGGDMLTKIYKAPASWNAEARSAKFVMSAEVTDRYGDIVVAKGIRLDDFIKNPVVLWAHDNRQAPIGMWSDVKAVSGQPKRLEGVANFASEEVSEKAEEVARLVEASMVRACSIGFMMLEWEAVDKENPWGGWRFLESDLLECSICSVPANPLALVKAAGEGDSGVALQAIELVLDEWTRTPAGTIVPRAAFEKAYKVIKNADAPTLVEVKAIEEDAGEIVVTDKPEQKDLAERIIEGVGNIIAKALGTKQAPAPVEKTEEPELTPETVVELNTAAEEEIAAALATEAEEKRVAAEAVAAQKEIEEQEELELRARAAMAL